MADIPPSNFGIFTVRVITRDNQPWFVANDICNALDYSNTSKAIGDQLVRPSDAAPSGQQPHPQPRLARPRHRAANRIQQREAQTALNAQRLALLTGIH